MRHATEIKAGEATVGMSFRYDSGTMIDGKYIRGEEVATVTEITLTKTGRVKLRIDGGRAWTNRAISPTSPLQGK